MKTRSSYLSRMGDEMSAAVMAVLDRHRDELKRRRLSPDLIAYYVGFYSVRQALLSIRTRR